MDYTTVVDNVVIEDSIPVVIEDSIPVVIEDSIPAVVIEDKPVVKKSSKKLKEEIDFNADIYLDHFEANTNYTNQQRISIFRSELGSELTDVKIGKLINK
jgi:hypothetical protein